MKNRILLLSTLIIFSTFIGCKKDESLPAASMSAKVDGNTWSTVARVARHTTTGEGQFVITGTSLTGSAIVLTTIGDDVGEYLLTLTMTEDEKQIIAVYQPDVTSPTENNYVAKSGSIKITDINTEDKLISGTFSFNAYKNILNVTPDTVITEGVFSNLQYSE